MYFYSLYNPQFRILTGGEAPVNLTAPVVSGGTSLGSVLTTTNGTWSGTLPFTYTYQWQRNGLPISGATSSTYTIVVADSAAAITCVVTATNAIGNASANSNAIAVISFEQSLINAFKTRVQNDGGTYEAESCQLAQLTALNAIA